MALERSPTVMDDLENEKDRLVADRNRFLDASALLDNYSGVGSGGGGLSGPRGRKELAAL